MLKDAGFAVAQSVGAQECDATAASCFFYSRAQKNAAA